MSTRKLASKLAHSTRRGGEALGVVVVVAIVIVYIVFLYYYFTWMMNAPTLLSAVKRIGLGIILALSGNRSSN